MESGSVEAFVCADCVTIEPPSKNGNYNSTYPLMYLALGGILVLQLKLWASSTSPRLVHKIPLITNY